MIKKVVKRNGDIVDFDFSKIKTAIEKAYKSCSKKAGRKAVYSVKGILENEYDEDKPVPVEEIQNLVESEIAKYDFDVARAYVIYRYEHQQAREIAERISYMDQYKSSSDNAATASETDANANVTQKNVANLEGEVYKTRNRIIQRWRMKNKLQELFPEVADQYEKDIENHIIYVHDEASSPTPKFYCQAASMYPLMDKGTGEIDNVTPSAPNDIQSFSGQATNLVFLLSSQCKGAVALGEYIIALNYYVVMEFGEDWYNHVDDVISSGTWKKTVTIKSYIRKGMKQFIYGINQPAGNRSYNSPFSNISYYDRIYFNALFENFYYPDGTQPKWEAIDVLQRIFMELHRELRLIKPLTFPVTTMAMVHNGTDVIDKEYKKLCAEEYAKGGSFFTYLSDNPSSLASCCRVLNEITENTFSSVNGLQGIMTGSCNVITLNINRIVQDHSKIANERSWTGLYKTEGDSLKAYLIEILERVYKYHIAYKSILYEWEDAGMYSSSNAGYIYIKKLYSTIGLIGYCEAAQFLGMKISDNDEYKNFLKLVFGTVKEQNKIHSINDKNRPFRFNSEAIPGENLAVKFYEWDKNDGYFVPEDQNLYSSYFFLQWDDKMSVLEKLRLHGKYINSSCDGGQACHIHMDEHLSEEQYSKILDYCVKEGVNYFTFNVPMSECKSCGHVVNAPVDKCPKCGSDHIDYWTRIIGYLRPVSNWSSARNKEFKKRVFSTNGV